ncbi:MAG TPA: hypothetical protein VF701_18055 [Thermoanaerobaculia bacterium]
MGDEDVTKREFDRALIAQGFSRQTHPVGGTRFVREVEGQKQYVARDNVHAGSWRLLLAAGDVPEVWPADQIGGSSRFVEAESKWFEYFNDLDPSDPEDAQFDDSAGALRKLFGWFQTVGMQWLSNPTVMSDDMWRREHNLLVRVDGRISVGPRIRKLPP